MAKPGIRQDAFGPLLGQGLRKDVVAGEKHVADADADVTRRVAGRVENPQPIQLVPVFQGQPNGHVLMGRPPVRRHFQQFGTASGIDAGMAEKAVEPDGADRGILATRRDRRTIQGVDGHLRGHDPQQFGQAADVIDVAVSDENASDVAGPHVFAELVVRGFDPGQNVPRRRAEAAAGIDQGWRALRRRASTRGPKASRAPGREFDRFARRSSRRIS